MSPRARSCSAVLYGRRSPGRACHWGAGRRKGAR
jgi:hypothetical protein